VHKFAMRGAAALLTPAAGESGWIKKTGLESTIDDAPRP
jgi:hypothetical protein